MTEGPTDAERQQQMIGCIVQALVIVAFFVAWQVADDQRIVAFAIGATIGYQVGKQRLKSDIRKTEHRNVKMYTKDRIVRLRDDDKADVLDGDKNMLRGGVSYKEAREIAMVSAWEHGGKAYSLSGDGSLQPLRRSDND